MGYTCEVCEKSITIGDVLLDWNRLRNHKAVDEIMLVCKSCSKDFSSDLHNIWELTSFIESSMHVMAGVLLDLSSEHGVLWSPKAIESIYRLIVTGHPELAQD